MFIRLFIYRYIIWETYFYNAGHISTIFDVDKILPPQVKRILIISNNHGIYQLPHELPNNLDLGPLQIRKYQEDLKTP